MSRKNISDSFELFTPKTVRKLTTPGQSIYEKTWSDIADEPFISEQTGSLSDYLPVLKSTQQLPIDFSKFENHTFFSSAEANVNVSFQKIINDFPFDGTKNEYDEFIDGMTGFEKQILKDYPSYKGFLTFHPSASQHIKVRDKQGVLFPGFSRNRTGNSLLAPRESSFTLEGHFCVGEGDIDKNIICQLYNQNSNVGFSIFCDSSAAASPTAKVRFAIVSGSQAVTASTMVEKGKFSHLTFIYDRSIQERRALIYSGSDLLSYSARNVFPTLDTAGVDLLIGSGSSFRIGENSEVFSPVSSFSGSINEFRYFSRARTKDEIRRFSQRNVFSTEDLLLYFRFNEPSGSYDNKSVVLDSGGKSFHSRVTNYTDSMRELEDAKLPRELVYEDEIFHPVLFPSFQPVVDYNSRLLTSASRYDSNNPNMITKLIPSYLLDMAAANAEISTDPNGEMMSGILPASPGTDFPGGASVGQAQIIASLLFVWAREFDNLKAYIDHFSDLIFCDYKKEGSAAEMFLPFVAEYYGLKLPNFFSNTKSSQFNKGSFIQNSGMSEKPLREVRNAIWRRVLTNMRDVVLSKGTTYAIKSMFRSCGIEPSRYLRFIEYGGTVRGFLGKGRETITQTGYFAHFSGSFDSADASKNSLGFSPSSPYIVGHPLSASRVQPGVPEAKGHFLFDTSGNRVGTTEKSDGLLTSGSWTLESRCLFQEEGIPNLQSIIRLQTQGTGSVQPLILNLVANKEEKTVTLYYRPSYEESAPSLVMPLTGVNIFNGDPWMFSVSRKRGDEFIQTREDSQITLRASRQVDGKLFNFHVTSSAFNESHSNPALNMCQNLNSDVNHQGMFFVIGSQSLAPAGANERCFLNSRLDVTASAARHTVFNGRTTGIRFWSKALTENESLEHARDFRSLGVDNPDINFGFTDTLEGSFAKLRLDVSMDQPVTGTNADGELELIDFSQSFVSGAVARSFDKETRILKPYNFRNSILSPHIDEAPASSKIRIIGMDEPHLAREFGRMQGPGYQIFPDQQTREDNRFSIELSMMGPLNEDIARMFSTFDYLDNAIGAPEHKFATEYKSLQHLRRVYFNRLSSTMNYSLLFDYYRFLDDSFDDMIDLLIPRSTDYLGFNFIVENHILERFKYCYQYGDVYLGEIDRRNLKGTFLLRQLVGDIGRYI